MKQKLSGALGVVALLIASTAHANPAASISKLENKLNRLSHYFDGNCDEDALTPKCKRVEASIIRIGGEIERLKEAVSVNLRTSASVATNGEDPTILERQYSILHVRMEKIMTFIERLEASDDPQKEAKIKGLNAQLDLVRNRLLQLQIQSEG